MAFGESEPLVFLPSTSNRNSNKKKNVVVLSAAFGALLLIGTMAIISQTSTNQSVALEQDDDMLQPYYAWQAELAAKQQDQQETSELSEEDSNDDDDDDDTQSLASVSSSSNKKKSVTAESVLKELANDTPHVQISHSKIRNEMVGEFKDRDLLKDLKKALRNDRSPRAQLAQRISADQTQLQNLEAKLKAIQVKKAQSLERLKQAQQAADPLLQKANFLLHKSQSRHNDYIDTLQQAKHDISTGEADLLRAANMRHEFFAEEQPIEDAQEQADEADKKYRTDALRFANAMVNAETMGKNPKLRSAAEKKINTLRQQVSLDQVERESAMHKLEQSQGDIHVQAGLQDYNRWKLRGEQLINKGKTLLHQSTQLKLVADQWTQPAQRAEKQAADAETVVHDKRDHYHKAVQAQKNLLTKKKSLLHDKSSKKHQLRQLEQRDATLRKDGAQLMLQYHELEKDIAQREKNRAKLTAERATKNDQALKTLLADTNEDED